MNIKYVVVDEVYPYFTGAFAKHSDFSYLGEITSAGFCSFKEVPTPPDRQDIYTATMFEVAVWGESTSCKVKSLPSDAKLIARMLNG